MGVGLARTLGCRCRGGALDALHSPDDELREASLYALGQLRAAAAVLAIREALNDKSERVRFEARMALQALDASLQSDAQPKEHLPPVLPQQSGEVGRFIGEVSETVTHVAFLPAGHQAVSADRGGGIVRLWDLTTAKEIRCLRIQDAREAFAFSTDGRWVACGGMYQRLRLMNLDTGSEKRHFSNQGALMLLAIRPQGNQVVSVDMPRRSGPPYMLHVWHVDSGKETHTFQLPFSSVTKLAFSADGRRLFGEGASTIAAEASRGPICRIWDVDTDKMVFERAFSKVWHRRRCLLFRWAEDLGCGFDAPGWASVWDIDSGEGIATIAQSFHDLQHGPVFRLSPCAGGKK